MTNETIAAKKPRLGWLDALRGFTMILVVTNHVALKSFGMQIRWSAALQFFLLFRMPLFFFISGFLAYKASRLWDARTLRELSLKKMRVQLIPTIVFFLLYLAMIPSAPFLDSLQEALASGMKAGYWFTLVLLYMLLTYYLFSYVESKFFRGLENHGKNHGDRSRENHGDRSMIARTERITRPVPVILLFVVSLCLFETCYLPHYFSWALGYKGEPNAFMNYSSLVEMIRYFPFFLFGTMVHRYWDRAQRLMDSSWFFPVVTVLAVVCTLEVIVWHNLRLAWASFPHTLAMFLLLSMVFMFFRYYHDFFEQTRFGLSLQFIGRRTLDIYLLHYFFLPKLPMVGEFFRVNRHNFILDTTASLAIALLVVAFCVLASNILRVSPFLKKYLFGR
jgi:fucose 4-O-acetylase-like acetyltransferase